MKRIFGFIALLLTVATAVFGFDAETVGFGILAAGPAAAGSINIGEMADEMKKLFKTKPGLPVEWFLNKEVQIRKYATRVAKIKNQYHIPFTLMSPIVQGFKQEWTPLGKLHILARTLRDYHLKIDLPIDPSEILGVYLGEDWYEEDKKHADRSISMYIANQIAKRSVHDMNILLMDGEYDSALMNTEFGYSMKGLNRIMEEQIALTIAGNTEHPYYMIPGDNPLDEDNIVAELRYFERNIPERFKSAVKKIFVPTYWGEEHQDQYESEFGANTNFTDDKKMKTRGGREIVNLESTKLGNKIFASIDMNLIDMVDKANLPAITDVQTDKRQVVLIGEGHAGIDWGINQMVFVRTEATNEKGLQNAEQNKLFFDETGSGSSGSES